MSLPLLSESRRLVQGGSRRLFRITSELFAETLSKQNRDFPLQKRALLGAHERLPCGAIRVVPRKLLLRLLF